MQPAVTLGEALDGLRSGRLTVHELISHAVDQAQASTEHVNAFSVVARDRALAAAEESQRRYNSGTARSLEGLPIAVKDLIDTQNMETCYGSAAYAGHVPEVDADIVRVLVQQGAIVLGKTRTHEFGWGVTTTSPTFGNTLNPFDLERIPGGSSGGAAAALSYGVTCGSLGTDTGGSVRIPATLCGVVGFKPTFGALPRRGIFPLAHTLDHPGLLGRDVRDIQILAKACGLSKEETKSAATIRLGIIHEVRPVPLSEDVAQAFDAAIARLEKVYSAALVTDETLFEDVFNVFAGIVLTEGGVTHFSRSDPDRIATEYSPETADRLERAKGVSLRDYSMWQEGRRTFMAKLGSAMADIDFLLLPTCPCVAPRINETEIQIGSWSGTIREALMAYTAPFNVAGFPAISVPLRSDRDHLPMGLQIVAHPHNDAALVQFARAVEAHLSEA
jgi:aspartyl-tRNA(Asn)/glutamyl-tRNA(Gln) amidotransferase subunit A